MKLINRSIQIFWFILCIIHLKTICFTYMDYKTVSDTISSYPDPSDAFGIELCFKYADIINASAINAKYPDAHLNKYSINFQTRIQEFLTGRDILDFTPDANQLIYSCKIRKRSNPKKLAPLSQTLCNQHFAIEKYFIGSFVCYDLVERNISGTPYLFTVTDHAQPRTVHEVALSDAFFNSTLFRPVIHSLESLPDYSRTVAPTVERLRSKLRNRCGDEEMTPEGIYMLTYSRHIFHELSRPYGPYLCHVEIGENLRSLCTGRCMNNHTIEMLNKTSYAFHIRPKFDTELLDYKMISSSDLENETLTKLLDHFDTECRKNCMEHVCTFSQTVTTLNTGFRSRDDLACDEEMLPHKSGSIIIASLTSNHPLVTNTKVVKVTLSDLIVYITSVLGTWFGLVIIKVTPESVWRYLVTDGRKVAPGDRRVLKTPPEITVAKVEDRKVINLD